MRAQGENDADNWLFLGCGLPAMIADIRLKLGSPALPFSFVDLAAWDKARAPLRPHWQSIIGPSGTNTRGE